MSQAAQLRTARKAEGKPVSFNDIIAWKLTQALAECPAINAITEGDVIRQKHHVNLGIAVAVENGLIVPTLFHAERMSLSGIHDETGRLATRAKKGQLTEAEYHDGTFTLTNLGMFGLDEFVAIINPPQVGILAVGAIVDTPVVQNGGIFIRPICTLTLSYDHRAIDGAPAAKFLHRVKELLETP